jgi:predicted esterase
MATAISIDRDKGCAHLDGSKTHAQRVEQKPELGFIDLAVGVAIDAVEAVLQGIVAHAHRLRRFWMRTKPARLLALGVFGCQNGHETAVAAGPTSAGPSEAVEPHPLATASISGGAATLAPLRGEWLEHLGAGDDGVAVTPPLGAITPSLLVVGVHGAGDRPEWSCGGWRLATQASAFVVCPRGSAMSPTTYAWASSKMLAARVTAAVQAAKARYGAYVASGPLIFAGFSQGATLSEPLLREQAARFPIVILAEGGYATARSPSFAAAFHAAGGRRIVLVCGTPACFRNAQGAGRVLERAELEVLVVGDEKAGHNLNERMQHALQSAWPQISAPLR